MNTIDILFLAVAVAVLTALLASSRVLRAIAWESLRHPFTPSRIEVQDGKVRVSRQAAPPSKDSPAGVR